MENDSQVWNLGSGVKILLEFLGKVVPDVSLKELKNIADWNPQVGDGCSYGHGNDRYPYTVRRVSPSGKTIWVSRDDYKVKASDAGAYIEGERNCWFTPKETELDECEVFKLKDDGRFRQAGRNYRGKPALSPGRRFACDPSF